MGTNAEWPTLRRIVVDAFQNAGQVLTVAQEASSLTGILGLVTAGVGITIFTGMPRFCGEHAIVPKPIVTDPAVIVETHLAWRRASLSGAMRRFIETSETRRQELHALTGSLVPPVQSIQKRGTSRWKTGLTARR